MNRLSASNSPYLLQHAHNPVAWHPWDETAFEAARQADKPIFLSIGYATCHWCHVMAHESFEDPAVARVLNETFVNIKVDREMRPDIDALYMGACHLQNGSGGWPLSVFLTPDKKPFFAATYLPKTSQMGRMGMVDLSQRINHLWQQDREKLLDASRQMMQRLPRLFEFQPGELLEAAVVDLAFDQTASGYDTRFGGFGQAPKFPTAHRLQFLMDFHGSRHNSKALPMVVQTLKAMRRGGIWDHVGYGFHRYATDERWLLPHFEKMLYDQATLAQAYLQAYELTADPELAQTAEDIFEYVMRDLGDPGGAFYAAEDADSEGREGKFYVWHHDEFRDLAGPGHALWESIFNLDPEGNFEDEATRQRTGENILHLTRPLVQWARDENVPLVDLTARWQVLRLKLLAERSRRVRPQLDDKILTDWNGMMIAALAEGARVLGKPVYLEAALGAWEFIRQNMTGKDGGLVHGYRQGKASKQGFADDYAAMVQGLLALYRLTGQGPLLDLARDFQKIMDAHFLDPVGGGYFMTVLAADQHLPIRPKEMYDGAIPSANSMALTNLLHLAELTGESEWRSRAETVMRSVADAVRTHPTGFNHFLRATIRLTPNAKG